LKKSVQTVETHIIYSQTVIETTHIFKKQNMSSSSSSDDDYWNYNCESSTDSDCSDCTDGDSMIIDFFDSFDEYGNCIDCIYLHKNWTTKWEKKDGPIDDSKLDNVPEMQAILKGCNCLEYVLHFFMIFDADVNSHELLTDCLFVLSQCFVLSDNDKFGIDALAYLPRYQKEKLWKDIEFLQPLNPANPNLSYLNKIHNENHYAQYPTDACDTIMWNGCDVEFNI